MDILHYLLLIDAGLLVLIWLVQLVIYPAFRHIEEAGFADWHQNYTLRVGIIVGPLLLAQVALMIVLHWQNPKLDGRILVPEALVAIAWIITYICSVPCHRTLSSKKDHPAIELLIRTNWLRTLCWTTTFLIHLWLAVTST